MQGTARAGTCAEVGLPNRRNSFPVIVLCSLAGGGALGSCPVLAADPPSPAPAPTAVPLDVFFRGAVVGLDGTKVRLRYDFSSAEQKKDWIEGVPWAIAKDASDGATVADGRCAVRGNAGARHVAEWTGDVSVTCRLVPDGVKDIGGYLSTPDSASDYVSYTIAETYFHSWDKKAGGETGIMKFEKQYSAVQGGGFIGFRYLGSRMPPNPPAAGKAVAFGFGRQGTKLFLTLDDLKIESSEPAPRMKGLYVGVYSIQSSMTVDDVVIEGTLAPRWLSEKHVALTTQKPIVADAGPAALVDPAVEALIADYAAGKASVTKLIDLLQDPSRPDGDRQATAHALKKGPKKAVRAVIDLLYNAEVKIRATGIDIVKSILGKNYGYDPKAGEKARSAAIARLQKDLEDHPELTQGGGN